MKKPVVLLLFVFFLFGGCIYAQPTVPYAVNKKALPAGTDFSKLIPLRVGSFERVEYKAPQPGLDGEAVYRWGTKEIFVLFSLAETWQDVRETMKTVETEIKNEKAKDAKLISIKTNPAYILFIGETIAFYAWTREKYCFSADAKGGDKIALDSFVKNFPY